MELLDQNGCLTSRGVDAVRTAAPGEIPHQVAAHLTTCDSCQSRVLSDGQATQARRKPPSYNATLAAFVAIMMALVTLVLALRILSR